MVKLIYDYMIEEQIGQGSFGKVFKGYNVKTNEIVAIKVMPKEVFKASPKLEQCLQNQIKILNLIGQTPHIINFIKGFRSENNFYMIYQFCNGGTLHQLLTKRRYLPENEAIALFEQLIQAFKLMSQYHILHRDLKPENIFFKNGKIKIGDFGFSKTLKGDNAVTATMIGSPIYMAPQVIKGQLYTAKADIWSLGVIVYQMLYGFCPFQSNSIAGLILSLDKQHLKFPRTENPVSQRTIQLLKRMLEKDPSKRISWQDLFKYFSKKSQKLNEIQNTSYTVTKPMTSYYKPKTYSQATDTSSQGRGSTERDSPSNFENPFQKKIESEKHLDITMRFNLNGKINNLGNEMSAALLKLISEIPYFSNSFKQIERNHRGRIEACNLALDIFIDDQKEGSMYYYFILDKVRKQLIAILSAVLPFQYSLNLVSILEQESQLISQELKLIEKYFSDNQIQFNKVCDVGVLCQNKEYSLRRKPQVWNKMINYLTPVGVTRPNSMGQCHTTNYVPYRRFTQARLKINDLSVIDIIFIIIFNHQLQIFFGSNSNLIFLMLPEH